MNGYLGMYPGADKGKRKGRIFHPPAVKTD